MKKVNVLFFLLKIIAVTSAFAISSQQLNTNGVKRYRIIANTSFRIYVEDITNLNSGDQYECIVSPVVCTFVTDKTPYYDVVSGFYYFVPPILIVSTEIVEGDFIDLRGYGLKKIQERVTEQSRIGKTNRN